MTEEWKPVVGFESCYEVSNQGRVRSLPRVVDSMNRWGPVRLTLKGKLLALLTDQNGYLKVLLSQKGRATNKLVAVLVAEAFLGQRPKGLFVLHSDGNAKNNYVANLRYGTQAENMRDSMVHGTRPYGSWHKCARLTEKAVRYIRASKDTNAALARKYGVDTSTVRLARIGQTWKYV